MTGLVFFVNLLIVGLLSLWVGAQDLQFGCISCEDKFQKCEMDCASTYLADGVAAIGTCKAECTKVKEACVDSDNAINCRDCMYSCAVAYDVALRNCLKSIPRTIEFTTEYSPCESTASTTMDSCMLACSDKYAK